MFAELNASGFEQNSKFYNAEFEIILSKIISCYRQMLADNVTLRNDENGIRDYMLTNYLKKQWFKRRFDITGFLFDKELVENTGRIDIRIMPLNPFIADEAYYIIECKRLNSKNQTGKSGLNSEYISEGICRFVNNKYSSYYKTSGMIGFVVESIDIDKNVTSLNTLLDTSFTHSNTINQLTKKSIVSDFPFSYYSTHTSNKDELLIYHLMLDFANYIK